MKTKITTSILVALMLISGISQAQYRKKTEGTKKAMIQLTEEQKKDLRANRIEFSKATIDVKNELNELKAYQKTLMSAEKLNEKEIFENIDKMTVLKKRLMEERIEMRLACSGLLDDEQRMCKGMCSERSKMRKQHMRHGKGQKQQGNRKAQFERRKDRFKEALNLSEAQQEQMKNLKLEHKKASQNLREEMQELRLKQKHLLNDEKPNKKAIQSNIDRMSSIQNQLAKERVLSQKEIRDILDEDQLVLFLSKAHHMQKRGKNRMHRAF